ncbi:MAG: hydrolase [Spirochaetaceae bacterium]|nr:MAG: hydrolase [Spirochaetaceae bacterium]
MSKPTRDQALSLLQQYTKTESLLNHARAVEAVMRYCARKRGYDEEQWGVIGLVHDLDWEMYPTEHCIRTEKILRDAGWPDDYVRAVLSHAWGMFTDVQPQHEMEKVLYTIDELTGLVTATALMRPSKSVLDMQTRSVRKKWKDKSFAAGVNRSVVEKGAEMLGVSIDQAIEDTIMGMREAADDIGLHGAV